MARRNKRLSVCASESCPHKKVILYLIIVGHFLLSRFVLAKTKVCTGPVLEGQERNAQSTLHLETNSNTNNSRMQFMSYRLCKYVHSLYAARHRPHVRRTVYTHRHRDNSGGDWWVWAMSICPLFPPGVSSNPGVSTFPLTSPSVLRLSVPRLPPSPVGGGPGC